MNFIKCARAVVPF